MIPNPLKALIQQSRASSVGLAARLVSGRDEILINADESFHPASTIKICVMMEAFRQAHAGQFALDEPIVVRNGFHSLLDGSPYSLDPADDTDRGLYHITGQSVPGRELIQRMIAVSSNLATNLLLEQVGADKVTRFMADLGAPGLIVRRGVEDKQAYRAGLNNAATARGLMEVLLKLAKQQIVSAKASDEMIKILCQQQFNEMIPALLPAGTRVAHKTGWAADYYHDAGIIYPVNGEPFVLAVLTKGYEEHEEAEAHAFVASLARAVYDHWSQ